MLDYKKSNHVKIIILPLTGNKCKSKKAYPQDPEESADKLSMDFIFSFPERGSTAKRVTMTSKTKLSSKSANAKTVS